jgi:hypothetical protein
MSPIGTFLPCQPRRAMSGFKGKAADICSMRVLRILTLSGLERLTFAAMHGRDLL